jgi:predicted DNA-binding transcriptional regulator YafY
MGRTKPPAPAGLTAARAARLYKLLTLLGTGPQTRRFLLTRLKLDIRGFYRDLASLRRLGIEVAAGPGNKYLLAGELDAALARLPFPDPGLNVRDALLLADGPTAAHRKLRQRVNAFLQGGSAKSADPKKSR